MNFILKPGTLRLQDIRLLMDEATTITLSEDCLQHIHDSESVVTKAITQDKPIYGINTGFGALAVTRIPLNELTNLQKSLLLSHAAGTGKLCSTQVVRLMLALKINSLARGYSGVRLKIIEFLITLFNEKVYPCIPSQGSVGASGDLAPLAHLSTVLIGVGEVEYSGRSMSAQSALAQIGLKPIELAPKEGLALVNGTQASTALALLALFAAENIYINALMAGAMTVDASKGSDQPFDERIHLVRGYPSQIDTAQYLRELLQGSEIRESHRDCDKVQDPYSLRCQPQVMGACLTVIRQAAASLMIEANAVSDNPLIFCEQQAVLSGGNFHAEPVAITADTLAIAIAEMAALSERRIAMLMDDDFTGLPAFLVKNPGVNSGFMLAHVTAAALASENKTYAHPASVDSLPTSANQEDHVSMATFAANRLLTMAENAVTIIGIEFLAAAQALDFLAPLQTSQPLQRVHQLIRKHIPFYDQDRYFAPDIAAIKALILDHRTTDLININIF